MPQYDAGTRIEPPWSPPMAIETAPEATRTALPEDEPPAERLGSRGLRTGPVAQVWLPAPEQKYSQFALPAITPPPSRMRVTTVASKSGMNPSRVEEPADIGTPATQTVSFTATRCPASGPESAPAMSVSTAQALSGSSSRVGRRPGVRG